MANLSSAPSNDRQQEGLTSYGSHRPKILKLVLVLTIVLSLVFLLKLASSPRDQIENNLVNSKTALTANGYTWTAELISSFEEKHLWLQKHGAMIENVIYEKLGTIVFSSASIMRFDRDEVGTLPASFIELHFALLQGSFFLLAGWRLWLCAIIVGFLYSKRKINPHKGNDILGESGSGLLYDSAITIDLKDLDAESSLNHKQLTGLACPHSAPREVVRKSNLYSLIQSYGAINDTNLELIGIILYYNFLPAYLENREDNNAKIALDSLQLSEVASLWIQLTLNLQSLWQVEGSATPKKTSDADLSLNINSDFESIIGDSLSRIQTAELKHSIANTRPELLATLILAQFASRPLVYDKNGQELRFRSRYPELAGRAILQSLPACANDYNSEEQKCLRRCFVFASRQSEFTKIQLPIDMDLQTVALRNWSELMQFHPNQIELAANSVELVSLFDKLHQQWKDNFLGVLSNGNDSSCRAIFATNVKLLFIQPRAILKVLSGIVDKKDLSRFEQLIALTKQGTKNTDLVASSKANKYLNGNRDVTLDPLSFINQKELTRAINLSEEEIKLWSLYRIVLHRYGWLVAKVGDFSVPDSGVVFPTFSTSKNGSSLEAEILGIAMVALRISNMTVRADSSLLQSANQLQLESLKITKDSSEAKRSDNFNLF